MNFATQDYQSYYSAYENGQSELACNKKLCGDYSIKYGGLLSVEDRNFLIFKIGLLLPSSARIEIVKYLIQLYRTDAPIQNFLIVNGIKNKFLHDSTVWLRLYTSRQSPYLPLCRGYCVRCGGPENKYSKITNKKVYKLNAYRLNCMTLCFECCIIGYQCVLKSNGQIVIDPPRLLRTSRLEGAANQKLPLYLALAK